MSLAIVTHIHLLECGAVTGEVRIPARIGAVTGEVRLPTRMGAVMGEVRIPTQIGALTREVRIPLRMGAVTGEVRIPTRIGAVTGEVRIPTRIGAVTGEVRIPTRIGAVTAEVRIPTRMGAVTGEVRVPTRIGATPLSVAAHVYKNTSRFSRICIIITAVVTMKYVFPHEQLNHHLLMWHRCIFTGICYCRREVRSPELTGATTLCHCCRHTFIDTLRINEIHLQDLNT
jgi:hypothetical protein